MGTGGVDVEVNATGEFVGIGPTGVALGVGVASVTAISGVNVTRTVNLGRETPILQAAKTDVTRMIA